MIFIPNNINIFKKIIHIQNPSINEYDDGIKIFINFEILIKKWKRRGLDHVQLKDKHFKEIMHIKEKITQ